MNFLFLVFLFLTILSIDLKITYANQHNSQIHVMIDPGHGGTDSGATQGSIREADIALKVSLFLKNLLDKDSRFLGSLTRNSNINLTLEERVSITEKAKADLFISIHANASKDKKNKGFELYFQNNLPADEDSLFLANTENELFTGNSNIQSEDPSKHNDILSIIEDLKRNHRMRSSYRLTRKIFNAWNPNESSAIRQAPFYVISNTNIPSILIELGFITNPTEGEKLMHHEYQEKIARKIYKGLLDYKDLVDKSTSSSLN